MYNFDKEFSSFAKRKKAIYSRYADDIYFSTNTPDVLTHFPDKVRDFLKNQKSPKLIMNEDKLTFTSKKRRRVITGLIITSKGEISIGRKKKRFIKSLVHQYSNNELTQKNISYLKGYLAYVSSVEPSFITILKEKYGEELLKQLSSEQITTLKEITYDYRNSTERSHTIKFIL